MVRSPSQQVGEGQPGTTELPIEPDAEVVQGYSCCQTRSQTLKLVRSLPPEAKSIEKFVVGALYDLPYPGYPTPQRLGPHLAGVAFGRADKPRSVAPEPPEVVICPLKALVDHVGYRGGRAHAPESGVRLGSYGEEGFGRLLISGGSGTEAEARDDPGGIDGGEQPEPLVPSQAITPTDVGTSGEPSVPPALSVPGGHRGAVQCFVKRLSSCAQKGRQVRDESLQEVHVGAHQPIKLRTLGQGGEGISQVTLSVAVEVPLARETAPAGEEGQGNHLALGEGGLWAGPLFWRMGVAEVVCDNVEYGEEGVHIEHEESVPFPWGSVSKPTLANGHLPLKSSPDNSHQAFKDVSGQRGVSGPTLRSGKRTKGSKWLRTALTEAAHAAAPTKGSYLWAHYYAGIKGLRGSKRTSARNTSTSSVGAQAKRTRGEW